MNDRERDLARLLREREGSRASEVAARYAETDAARAGMWRRIAMAVRA